MKRYALGCLIFLGVTVTSFGQHSITGTVTDLSGRSVLGTHVVSKTTGVTAIVDHEEKYRIDTQSNDTLIYYFYGYDFQVIPVNGRAKIDVVLTSPEDTLTNERIAASANRKRKVVMILVDGISTDTFHKVSTPYMDAMSEQGWFSPAYVGGRRGTISETPSISAVGYNSMLTGTWCHKHHVFGNSIVSPNYNYPTVFRIYKDAYPEGKIAIFSTWEDNRTKLLGEGLSSTGSLKLDYAFDGFELDTAAYPHDANKHYLKRIDNKVVAEAADYIINHGPDLSWVYLEHTDDMGHMHGDGPELYSAVTYEDALIGTIQDAVKLREQATDEEWLIIVTTDHGRKPTDGKDHGSQSFRERSTWVIMNRPIQNLYAQNNQVAIVDILPTVCNYLNIDIPASTANELDGISLTGAVDAFDLRGTYLGGYLQLDWLTEYRNHEEATVYVSYTNERKDGKEDQYKAVGQVDVQKRTFTTKINPPKKTPYVKVVLKTKNHAVTTWVKVKS
ncbi:alkaline phosphatase family protein [Reichenbachiella versicolor]|uniref:alkaline phosphatase family protein n=1 Tax=Reichenbachiella versicolor TaxID=1821036 RepID=UPI001C884227|nr:alkaline phosphatase family protein [Reichenbachiella versicolor]